jgi:hypothetical protein
MKHINTWYEKNGTKKRMFKQKYGRKPTKEEIKLLRKNQIDLSGTGIPLPTNNLKNVAEMISLKQDGWEVNTNGYAGERETKV